MERRSFKETILNENNITYNSHYLIWQQKILFSTNPV